jgi:hypothetical protein
MSRTWIHINYINLYVAAYNEIKHLPAQSNKYQPASNPFFPNGVGFDKEISAEGASSLRGSLHCSKGKKMKQQMKSKLKFQTLKLCNTQASIFHILSLVHASYISSVRQNLVTLIRFNKPPGKR